MQGFLRSSKSCTEMHKYTLYGRRITSGFPAFLCDTFMILKVLNLTAWLAKLLIRTRLASQACQPRLAKGYWHTLLLSGVFNRILCTPQGIKPARNRWLYVLCDTFMKIALVKYTSIEYDGVSHSLIVESKYSMDIFEEN